MLEILQQTWRSSFYRLYERNCGRSISICAVAYGRNLFFCHRHEHSFHAFKGRQPTPVPVVNEVYLLWYGSSWSRRMRRDKLTSVCKKLVSCSYKKSPLSVPVLCLWYQSSCFDILSHRRFHANGQPHDIRKSCTFVSICMSTAKLCCNCKIFSQGQSSALYARPVQSLITPMLRDRMTGHHKYGMGPRGRAEIGRWAVGICDHEWTEHFNVSCTAAVISNVLELVVLFWIDSAHFLNKSFVDSAFVLLHRELMRALRSQSFATRSIKTSNSTELIGKGFRWFMTSSRYVVFKLYKENLAWLLTISCRSLRRYSSHSHPRNTQLHSAQSLHLTALLIVGDRWKLTRSMHQLPTQFNRDSKMSASTTRKLLIQTSTSFVSVGVLCFYCDYFSRSGP